MTNMLTRPNALIGGLVLLLAFIALLAWRGSPYIYANAFQTAVETSDSATIVRLVAIDSVRQDLSDSSVESLPTSVKLLGGIVLSSQMRDLLNKSFKNLFIDRATTPQRIASLLRGEGVLPPAILAKIPSEMLTKRTMQVERGYGDTSDIFILRFIAKETGEEAAAVMQRTGWITWRVVAIRLSPPNSLLSPVRLRKE